MQFHQKNVTAGNLILALVTAWLMYTETTSSTVSDLIEGISPAVGDMVVKLLVDRVFSITRTRNFASFLIGCTFLHTWIHATVTAPVYDVQTGIFIIFSVSSGALLISLALAVAFRKYLKRGIYRPILPMVFALISAAGTVLMWASLPIIAPNLALTVIATVLTAIGTCGLLVIWGQAYIHLENVQACVLATFGSLLLSFVLYLFINPFPQMPALFITAVLPILSVLCARSVLSQASHGSCGSQGSQTSQASQASQDRPVHAAPKEKVIRPHLRLLAYIFAFSVPLNYLNLQMLEIGDGVSSESWSLVFSCVLVAVGAAITIEYALRKKNIAALSPITVVLVTSSLLLWAFFGLQNKTLMYIFMYGGYFLFVATFYTRLGLICFSGEYHPFVLFAIGNFVNVLGLLSGTVIGIVAEGLNSPGFAIVSILLTYALFFIGFIVMAKVNRKNLFADAGLTKEPQPQPQPAPTMVDLISEACAKAAKANNLTSRELEVLVYLVRGRSIQSIAEAIVLSQNTVKTHAHHIYQKFDAHTREELITAVESYASTDKPET